MIEIHWEILEEEGRTIKAIADLAKLPCKFTPKGTDAPSPCSQNTQIIDSLAILQQQAEVSSQLKPFFGQTPEQKELVSNLLLQLDTVIKDQLSMPVVYYYSSHPPPLPRELLNQKRKLIEAGVARAQEVVGKRKGKFICGSRVTAVDLALYFGVCNLVYFGKNHSNYPAIMPWFNDLYRIKEIKNITHQWFSMAKQIQRTLRPPRPRL